MRIYTNERPFSQFLIPGTAYFETGIKELEQFNFHACINLYIPSDFDYKTRIDIFYLTNHVLGNMKSWTFCTNIIYKLQFSLENSDFKFSYFIRLTLITYKHHQKYKLQFMTYITPKYSCFKFHMNRYEFNHKAKCIGNKLFLSRQLKRTYRIIWREKTHKHQTLLSLYSI